MELSQLPGSALLAKAEAFFAPGLATLQTVPSHRTEKTEDISDDTRDRDKRNGCRQIEWLDEVHRLDHVRPENEIENRLRPADHYKKRPGYMPAAN